MKKSNGIDTPFYRLMGHVGDLAVLNVLWLVCCLPVVTIGASTTGMFSVLNKLTAREDPRIAADFFKAFRRDFLQSTAVWLTLLAAGGIATAGLWLSNNQEGLVYGVVAATSFLLAAGVVCFGCWGLALLARFTYARGVLALMDGARMSVANLAPTVGILALAVWAPVLAALRPEVFVYLLPAMLLLGGSLSALGMAVLMRPAIARLEQAGRKNEEQTRAEEADGEEVSQ